MRSSPLTFYVYIFILVPLLLFVGFSILKKQNEFRLFPLFTVIILSIVLLIHTSTIVHFTKSMLKGEKIPIDKPLGYFILVLAVSLFCLNTYLLYKYNSHKSHNSHKK